MAIFQEVIRREEGRNGRLRASCEQIMVDGEERDRPFHFPPFKALPVYALEVYGYGSHNLKLRIYEQWVDFVLTVDGLTVELEVQDRPFKDEDTNTFTIYSAHYMVDKQGNVLVKAGCKHPEFLKLCREDLMMILDYLSNAHSQMVADEVGLEVAAGAA